MDSLIQNLTMSSLCTEVIKKRPASRIELIVVRKNGMKATGSWFEDGYRIILKKDDGM